MSYQWRRPRAQHVGRSDQGRPDQQVRYGHGRRHQRPIDAGRQRLEQQLRRDGRIVHGTRGSPDRQPTAVPAATSESSCTVDCVNPVASGESGWLAQVQGALQNVQQDLDAISSDTSNDPENLSLDGSQLEGDAQAALDPNYDPPPADNADWTAAMNDYVTAGEDYSGDNMNEQDDTPAQASQEIASGNSALASFNAANGGVLNGTIQS